MNINEDGGWPHGWHGLDGDRCIKCDTPTITWRQLSWYLYECWTRISCRNLIYKFFFYWFKPWLHQASVSALTLILTSMLTSTHEMGSDTDSQKSTLAWTLDVNRLSLIFMYEALWEVAGHNFLLICILPTLFLMHQNCLEYFNTLPSAILTYH